MIEFETTIWKGQTKDVTGIVVPDDVVSSLGAGKRPPVKVSVNGHNYRSTIASMRGRFMISLSAENRQTAGLSGGETVMVTLELDQGPRIVDLPEDFAARLDETGLRASFDALAYSHRKEHVRAIQEAKKPETRQRRIENAVSIISAKGNSE